MKLDLYNKKRNFTKTPEPKGKISKTDKNLYVIQKHAASHLHYDFRLELNGVLLSWAVPKGPCLDPTVKRLAMHVEDHPVDYGHFEGIIPQGQYGGGTVMLWDKGTWISLDENPTSAYHKGHLSFELRGKKLKGRYSLIKFKKDDDKSWFLVKGKDKYTRPFNQYDITVEEPNSVVSHLNLDEIANQSNQVWTTDKGLIKTSKKKSNFKQQVPKHHPLNIKIHLPAAKMPKKIYPQLATLVDKAPNGSEWLHEIKFDGYRIVAFKEGKSVQLISRNNRDWTNPFEIIKHQIQNLPIANAILDGEVVLLDDDGRPNFQLLQNAIGSNKSKPFIYYIFDLIYYDKYNLISLPLIERKTILHQLISSNHSILRYSDHIIGSGLKIFDEACKMGLEGIISKKINSRYEEKRSKEWLKTKCLQRQEFVIGGYSPPKRSRSYFGSLYLGYYDKQGHFKFCGNVGTGFTQASLKTIYQALQKYKINDNPFDINPPGTTKAAWVKPILVAEIEFSEWTNDGILRQPSFKGLRSDKPARTITREKKNHVKKIISRNESKNAQTIKLPFKLTNPNKVLYPEDKITKIDIARYYDAIHEWILPYIINRPLTLLRCPDLYTQCFYQKHLNKSTKGALFGIPIKEKDSVEECIYIKSQEGLMSLVQMSTLEIHPWGSRVEKVEYPDIITFDLDPAPDVSWDKLVSTAKFIRSELKALKLKSYVKTTGGKGLHVVIPIKPEYTWEQVKNFSHVFVKYLVANNPDDYIGEMSKRKRKGKIFIDYLRNQRGATAISAYSTRARRKASISVPIDWDELTSNQEDTFFTIVTLPWRLKILKQDPWHDFFKIRQSLPLDQL